MPIRCVVLFTSLLQHASLNCFLLFIGPLWFGFYKLQKLSSGLTSSNPIVVSFQVMTTIALNFFSLVILIDIVFILSSRYISNCEACCMSSSSFHKSTRHNGFLAFVSSWNLHAMSTMCVALSWLRWNKCAISLGHMLTVGLNSVSLTTLAYLCIYPSLPLEIWKV